MNNLAKHLGSVRNLSFELPYFWWEALDEGVPKAWHKIVMSDDQNRELARLASRFGFDGGGE